MLDKQLATMPTSSSPAMGKPEAHRQAKPVSSFHMLVEACKQKDLDQIKILLQRRPELITRCDRHQRSLLHYVSVLIEDDNGDPKRASACFDYLLALAGEKLWWHQDQDGLSTLHLAVISAHLAMVEYLTIVHPLADREPKLASLLDREGHSPLHWAVLTNSLASVKLIIQSGGLNLLYQLDTNQASPLHYATQFGTKLDYRNQIRRLIHDQRSFSFSQEDRDDEMATTSSTERAYAVLRYLVELVGVDLEIRDKDKRSPLLWAASSGNSKAIEMLLGLGANPLSCDINGLGPLHCAASHGFVDCLEAVLAGSSPDIVKVNHPDNLGCTPLFYAILSGNQDCIELLVNRGAQLDWQDSKGRTVAHFASLKGQLSSLKLLQDSGGNLWLPNKLGDLPLHYAIKGGRQQVVRWLLEHSPYEHSVNAINNLGRAPIHLAVQRDDMELVEYLTSCGANLNQLAKLRHVSKGHSSTSEFKYETALDLAKRLGNKRAMDFLMENNAKLASQVLTQRHLIRPQAFQSVEIESPIGFETSCSSASPKQSFDMQLPVQLPQEASHEEPEIDVHQSSISDSTGSSAMSHSSTTSQQERCRADGRKQDQSSGSASRGGISYSNDHICASIKCKLYPNETQHHQNNNTQRSDTLLGQQLNKPPEVVTNVRVYTSPCQSCHMANDNLANNQWPASLYYNPTSNYATVDESGYHKLDSHHDLFHHREDQHEEPLEDRYGWDASRHQSRIDGPLRSRLHSKSLDLVDEDDRLPVILSEQELSSSSGSPVRESHDEAATGTSLRRKMATRSPANEEPRFDRLEKETRRLPRKNVTSPVGQYIHSGLKKQESPTRQHDTFAVRPREASRRFQGQSYYKVPAKVDTHWHHQRPGGINKSTMHQLPSADFYDRAPRASSRSSGGLPSRSVSRQTVIKTSSDRRLSGGSEELASRVEKTIWKYRQETKLFEELQNLKRSQIRSGKANEAVLVKRLLDRLRVDATSQMIGLDKYQGPYTYKAYERYLYDQLRKLSMSNRAKLNAGRRSVELFDEDQMVESNDDARAELELRRILEDSDRYSESSRASVGRNQELEVALNDEESTPNVRESERESVHQRCLSRDSTQSKQEEVQHEDMKHAYLELDKKEEDFKEEADNLSSSIIVDALGNLSTGLSRSSEQLEMVDNAAPSMDEGGTVDETNVEEDEHESDKRVEKIPQQRSISKEELEEKLPPSSDEKPDLAASDAALDENSNLLQKEEQQETEEQTLVTGEMLNKDKGAAKSLDSTSNTDSKRGRRRSVINIGDKIDVIYHDIGIEIEPAPSDSLEEISEKQEKSRQTDAEAPVEPSSSSTQEPPIQEETSEEREEEEEKGGKEAALVVEEPEESKDKEEDAKTDAEERRKPMKETGDETPVNSPRASISRRTSLPQECVSSQAGLNKSALVRQAISVTDHESLNSSSEQNTSFTARSGSKASSQAALPPVKGNDRARKWRAEKRIEKPTPKRPRSIPPNEVYRPSVDVARIHDRWTEIKSHERSKLRSCNDLVQLSATGNKQEDEGTDYLLLYEINQGFCRHKPANNKREETSFEGCPAQSKTIVSDWCQRRLARIVDARRLKRTLSLPECLIYSNNLQRQFEILKL